MQKNYFRFDSYGKLTVDRIALFYGRYINIK